MSKLVRELEEVQSEHLAQSEHLVLNAAKCLLGYRWDSLAKAKVVAFDREVERVFQALGVEPFSEESVEKYKKSKIRWRNLLASVMEGLSSETLIAPLFLLSFGGLLFVGGFLFFVFGNWILKAPQISLAYNKWTWILPLIPSLLILSLALLLGNHSRVIRRYSWKLTPLHDYKEDVPLFALSRATEIAELLPKAKFSIDSLIYNEKILDPFMVMEYSGKKFYLDVWDEPKFEGRRKQ